MIRLFRWLMWLLRGKPMLKYEGYHCGCCGRWVKEQFEIPTYRSDGRFADTIGLCKYCEASDYDVCVRCECRFSRFNPDDGGQMCRNCWATSH